MDLDEVELVLPLKKSDELQGETNANSVSSVATSEKTRHKTTPKTTQKTTQIILKAIHENASITRKELAEQMLTTYTPVCRCR